MSGPLREAALAYAARGWAVLPLHSLKDGACTCGKPDCGAPAKHPMTKSGLKDATSDRDQIVKWWSRWPAANVGVRTGSASGVLVLDEDPRNGGDVTLAELESKHGPVVTLTARTGGGGRHFLFGYEAPTAGRTWRRSAGRGLDVKADGGYVVAPPSLHASGGVYAWLDESAPIAPAPGWLLELATRPADPPAPAPAPRSATTSDVVERARKYLAKTPPAVSGQGGHIATLLAAEHLVRGFELDDGAAYKLLCGWNARCEPSWTEEDLRHKIHQARQNGTKVRLGEHREGDDERERRWQERLAARRPPPHSDEECPPPHGTDEGPGAPAPTLGFNPTDTGNAERLVAAHGQDLRYVAARGWLTWTGQVWAPDELGEVMRRAGTVARMIDDEARACDDEDRRKRLRSWANATENAPKLDALIKIAASRRAVVASVSDFDRDPWLLNVKNGTLDLRTGTLRQHRREDMITKVAPVAFDPDATCPRWESVVARSLPGSETREFFQRALGMCLTGDVSEHKFFFANGCGANGKSVVFNAVRAILGPYAAVAAEETFLSSGAGAEDKIPTDLASMVGARLVIVPEVREGRTFNTGLIKQVSGGDAVRARFMRQDFFTFAPNFKLVVVSNPRPNLREFGEALARRLRLLPFEVVIPEAERDPQLGEKLRVEHPGIMAWLVRGCLAWQAHGLGRAPEVESATRSYIASEDALGQFFATSCVLEPGAWVDARELRLAYEMWARDSGEKARTPKTFNRRLRDLGSKEERQPRGDRRRGWTGIRLAQDETGAPNPCEPAEQRSGTVQPDPDNSHERLSIAVNRKSLDRPGPLGQPPAPCGASNVASEGPAPGAASDGWASTLFAVDDGGWRS